MRRNEVSRVVSRWVLVAGASLMITAAAIAPIAHAEEPRADLGHAAELRKFLGFEATPAVLQRAGFDADAYPDMTWGIPLSVEEAAEMQRRIALMHAAFPAILEVSRDTAWAGWWVDQPAGGVPVFQFSGDATAATAAIQRIMPSGADFRVIQVRHTLRELKSEFNAIHGALDELLASKVAVTGLRVDIIANRVVMSLDPLTESAQAALRDRFGGTLAFDREPIAEADLLGCASGCMPLKAGIGMIPANDNQWPCTVGYLARRTDLNPDQLVFVTAGHCVEGGTAGGPWKHGSTTIGSSLYFAGTLVEVFYSHSDGDVGVVKVDAGHIPTVKNRILTDASPEKVYNIEIALISGLQGPNMIVCRMGRTTGGPQCGPILNTDTTKVSSVQGGPSYLIDHVIVYGRDADSGDSGGPIFYTTGTPTSGWATLLGTHVHSDEGYVSTGGKGWYTPWDRGLGQLDANFPVIDLSVCVTSTCGF